MSLLTSFALGSAVTGGTAGGTVTGLFDSVVIGAGFDFVYGSGGTAGTVWLQTSYDDGASWMDLCAFNFATASQKRYAAFNQSQFGTVVSTPTDASMAGSAIATFAPGNLLRARYSNTGTYSGSTVNLYLVVKK